MVNPPATRPVCSPRSSRRRRESRRCRALLSRPASRSGSSARERDRALPGGEARRSTRSRAPSPRRETSSRRIRISVVQPTTSRSRRVPRTAKTTLSRRGARAPIIPRFPTCASSRTRTWRESSSSTAIRLRGRARPRHGHPARTAIYGLAMFKSAWCPGASVARTSRRSACCRLDIADAKNGVCSSSSTSPERGAEAISSRLLHRGPVAPHRPRLS